MEKKRWRERDGEMKESRRGEYKKKTVRDRGGERSERLCGSEESMVTERKGQAE